MVGLFVVLVGIIITYCVLTDARRVRDVVEKFRAKYGADEVEKYYSKLDVAVEVMLAA